jgi:hypothetical protein
MSVSNGYYGTQDNNPNLNSIFDSINTGVRQGVQYGRDIVDSFTGSESRRYGDTGNYAPFTHPDITAQYSNYRPQQPPVRQYHAPDMDRYGWGPGRGGTPTCGSLSRYPGIWMDNYGSGGRF